MSPHLEYFGQRWSSLFRKKELKLEQEKNYKDDQKTTELGLFGMKKNKGWKGDIIYNYIKYYL